MSNEIFIPLTIVKLIVGNMTRTNAEDEKDQLDEWINASDENMRAFEDCVEIAFRAIRPDPDASEFEYELYDITNLIINKIKGQLTPEEEDELNGWTNESPFNRQLLDELPKTDEMQTIYDWLARRWLQEREKSKLN